MNTKLILAASALVVLSGCQMTNVIDDMPADLTSFNVENGDGDALKVHFSGGMLTEAKLLSVIDEFFDSLETSCEGPECMLTLGDGTTLVSTVDEQSLLIVSNLGDLEMGEDGTFNPHYTYAAIAPLFYGSISSLPKGDLNYEGLMAYTASSDMDIPNLEEENYFSDFDMKVNFDSMTARIVEGVGVGEQAMASFDSGSLDISTDGTFIGTDGLLNEDPYKNKIYTHGSFSLDGSAVFGTFTSDGPFTSDDYPGEITFRGGFVGARALDDGPG